MKGNETKNNSKVGIIIAVIVVAVVAMVVGIFFVFNGKTVIDNNVDESTKNNVLTYLGIDSDGKPNAFNDDIVARGFSAENYNVLEFVNEYASVNNLFDTEEYFNDNINGCENNNDVDGVTRKCFLMSKDNFNMITQNYSLDYDFDKLDDNNKAEGKYLYKYQLAVSFEVSSFIYTVNSAVYEDDAKSKIVLDTTRVETDLETNDKRTDSIKFYLVKNGDQFLFDKVEVVNN